MPCNERSATAPERRGIASPPIGKLATKIRCAASAPLPTGD
jgi:hypothetical protein